MDLNAYHMFHFIGIGGMGMRALAKILLDKGIKISGSDVVDSCLLYTSPSPRDRQKSRMPSSA